MSGRLNQSRILAATLLATSSCTGQILVDDGPSLDILFEEEQFSRTYTTNEDFEEGTMEGVNHDSSDELRLDVDVFVFETPYLWSPLSAIDQVVRVDTSSGATITVDLIHGGGKACDNPSRTTVDIEGGVWLGCRGGQGANSGNAGGCEANAAVGPDNRVFHVTQSGQVDKVFYAGFAARAVALDAFGHIWVGNSYDGTVWEFDAQTGDCLRGETTVGVTGRPDQICKGPAICLRQIVDGQPCGSVARTHWQCREDGGTYPYGAMVDQDGYLWIKGGNQGLFKIDARHETGDDAEHAAHTIVNRYLPDADVCQAMYGLTVDFNGDVWTGGAGCDDVKHFNGKTGEFIGAYKSGGDTLTRGVAVDMDGNIWVANSNKKSDGTFEVGSVSQFDTAGRNLQTVFLEHEGKEVLVTTGVGVDAFGNIWAMGSGSNVIIQFSVTDPSVRRAIEVDAGMYTYSDFLGTALRTVTHRTQVAKWTTVLDSRSQSPEWREISWVAREPTGTDVVIQARCAHELGDLNAEDWLTIQNNPDAVPCNAQRYMAIRALLLTQGGGASPVLEELKVRWATEE